MQALFDGGRSYAHPKNISFASYYLAKAHGRYPEINSATTSKGSSA
ncbi:MAG: hypothetical protein V4560_03380 [Bacteroidota bacterium]